MCIDAFLGKSGSNSNQQFYVGKLKDECKQAGKSISNFYAKFAIFSQKFFNYFVVLFSFNNKQVVNMNTLTYK